MGTDNRNEHITTKLQSFYHMILSMRIKWNSSPWLVHEISVILYSHDVLHQKYLTLPSGTDAVAAVVKQRQ